MSKRKVLIASLIVFLGVGTALVLNLSDGQSEKDKQAGRDLSKQLTRAEIEAKMKARLARAEKKANAKNQADPPDLSAYAKRIDPAYVNGILDQLDSLTERLKSTEDEDKQKSIYKELLSLIRDADNYPGAALAMATYLHEGDDAETGLPFNVGSGGILSSAPTVRTLLLDQIMQKDATLGLEESRYVMDQLTNADEYALGLRNMSWAMNEHPVRSELEGRFSTLLDQTDWLLSPTAGMMESLDVGAHLASDSSFSSIVSMIQTEGEDGDTIRKNFHSAAGLAMDRIVLRDPDMVVENYLEDPQQFLDATDDYFQLASLISRVDITTEQGQKAFITYLNAPELSKEQLDYFIGVFPNANYLTGNRLTTSGEVGYVRNIVERFADTLEVVERLTNNGSIPQEVGARIRENLARHV